MRSAGVKWTVHLRVNTLAYQSGSASPTIRMEQVNSPGSALSPMQSRLPLLPTLEPAQRRTVQRRRRQQNAPRLHRSPRTCPPVLRPTCRCTHLRNAPCLHRSPRTCPPFLRPTRRCTCLRCIHRCTSLHRHSLIHNHTSNTLVHNRPTLPRCFHLTHSLLPLR